MTNDGGQAAAAPTADSHHYLTHGRSERAFDLDNHPLRREIVIHNYILH